MAQILTMEHIKKIRRGYREDGIYATTVAQSPQYLIETQGFANAG